VHAEETQHHRHPLLAPLDGEIMTGAGTAEQVPLNRRRAEGSPPAL
jgi:hypothetical protein